jgi:hypothetical protein
MRNETSEAEMDQRTALCDKAKRTGNAVGALLQQRAREAAKGRKRQADVNDVRAEMTIRSAANDICNACHNREHVTIEEIIRTGGTRMYRDAVAGFLTQAESAGAITMEADGGVFVADYDLLLASLGRYILSV